MAKWDLNKLPEGRKPLPDSWFLERAQMQERIVELEAKLAKAMEHVADYSNDPHLWKWAYATLAELTKERSDEKGEK